MKKLLFLPLMLSLLLCVSCSKEHKIDSSIDKLDELIDNFDAEDRDKKIEAIFSEFKSNYNKEDFTVVQDDRIKELSHKYDDEKDINEILNRAESFLGGLNPDVEELTQIMELLQWNDYTLNETQKKRIAKIKEQSKKL